MWESIFSFLAPILQSVVSSGASAGINALTAPSAPPSPGHGMPSGPTQPNGPAPMSGGTAGVSGSGTTTSPSGGMSFGGGYTGGPDPRDMASANPAGSPAGPSIPSSGFQTMGYPKTDQTALRQGLRGI